MLLNLVLNKLFCNKLAVNYFYIILVVLTLYHLTMEENTPIHLNCELCRCDAGHYQLNRRLWETISSQSFLNKLPADYVRGLSQVYLDRVRCLSRSRQIITLCTSVSPLQKLPGSLLLLEQLCFPQSLTNHLGNVFIDNITTCNRSELSCFLRHNHIPHLESKKLETV